MRSPGPPPLDAAFIPRSEVVERVGQHRVADPYRLLEDFDDPRTRSWLAAQQDRFRLIREQWRSRDAFRSRLGELASFEDCSVPLWGGSQAFYTCRDPGAQHPSLRTRRYTPRNMPAGEERVLLDPMLIDSSGRTTLDAWSPSRAGRLVACQLSADGTEQPVLRILDAQSLEFCGPPIYGCRFSPVAWAPDDSGFYYVRIAPEHEIPRVWFHKIGTEAEADDEIFGSGIGDNSEIDIYLDASGQRLIVMVDESAETEVWLLENPRTANSGYRIAACQDGQCTAWPGGDGILYLLTDAQAPRGRIVAVDASSARIDPGRTLIAQAPDATLESFKILDAGTSRRTLICVAWDQAGHTKLSCHDLTTGDWLFDVPLPADGIVTDLSGRPDSRDAWFSYTDSLTPPSVYRFAASTGTVTPWRPHQATARPRGVSASELKYASYDGTSVRLLLTSPAGSAGPRPAILHAYGAFGQSQRADYYELGLAWAEAGGVLAVACVRGGGEEGEAWHEAGMLAGKQRGIDDLVAAAEYLIEAGISAPGMIGVKGFSAGGLLAAAAMVQRPDLFAAVECTSPLLDMARYELTGLGAHWTGEFGSRDDPDELGWMLAYSPYHNVVDGERYPAVLLATFDGDTRVDPMHARKMCAALQHATGSDRPVLLRTEPGVGHGDRSESARLDYFADVLSFFARYLAGAG
jgi:prolyl oligopeptidase